MGTRSLTVFYGVHGEEITVMYSQFDGYPDGHGVELADFLSDRKLVHGYSSDDKKHKCFNGMGCLAAQVIGNFKNGVIGGVYLHPTGTRDIGEEYIYHIRGKEGNEASIEAYSVFEGKTLISSTASMFRIDLQIFNDA